MQHPQVWLDLIIVGGLAVEEDFCEHSVFSAVLTSDSYSNVVTAPLILISPERYLQ